MRTLLSNRLAVVTGVFVTQCLVPGSLSVAAELTEVQRLLIVEGAGNSAPERKAVDFAIKRIRQRSDVILERVDAGSFEVAQAGTGTGILLVGRPENNKLVREEFERRGMRPPGDGYPGPEGFVLAAFFGDVGSATGSLPTVVAAGADDRGTVFALGRLLRESRYLPEAMKLPLLTVVDKPAFEFRGLGISHMDPSQARRTGASQKFDYWNYVEDQMLFGFNAFAVGNGTSSVSRLDEEGYIESRTAQSRQVNEYGLLYLMQYAPNGVSREDWKDDFRGTHWGRFACPSIPAARKVILDGREALFRHAERLDVLVLVAGDIAGCHCEKCLPWVRTYVELCEEIAERYHRYHPDGKVWLTTQELEFEETQWLWDYLNEEPRNWIHALCYAPAGDEVSPYLTGRINPRYLDYAGLGPRARYLREVFRQVPRNIEVTTFPDISHWVSSQYELPEVAPEMAAVHERRTFNVRPRQMEQIFRETAGLTVGTSAYCEGIYDDVNKAVWTQLHWNPNQTVESILHDYFCWYCGPDAATEMVQASLLLEQNLQAQVLDNPAGFEQFLTLVKQAGAKIPAAFRKDNWRYLMFLEKGLTDLYVSLKMQEGSKTLSEARALLQDAEQSSEPAPLLDQARQVLRRDLETPRMKALRQEAASVDEELDQAAGYRFIALLSMVEYDLQGREWLARRIDAILDNAKEKSLSEQAGELLRYDDPGPGSFYDNCGHLTAQPRLKFGTSNYWRVRLPPGSRPAEVLHNYSMRGEQGVRYEYETLDRSASYRVRMALALPQRAWWARQIQQRLHADGQDISGLINQPDESTTIVEYAVPPEATRDGRLTLELVPEDEQSATAVSEIWLLKN